MLKIHIIIIYKYYFRRLCMSSFVKVNLFVLVLFKPNNEHEKTIYDINQKVIVDMNSRLNNDN